MTDQSEQPDAAQAFPALRQSTLANFDLCALLAHFEQTYRAGWDGHPQARGKLFHAFAARALAELHRQGESTMETDVGHAILNEVLRQHDVAPEEIVNIPMAQVRDLHWVVTKWCHDNVWDIANLVDVEQRLAANVSYPSDGGEVERQLTGQLDALFVEGEEADHAIVVDWKDTWAMPPESQLDDVGYFQQRFYAFLVFRNFPSVQRVTLREFYVRYSEPREATLHRVGLEEIEGQLAALAERFDRTYNTQVFPPSPGKHCQNCPRPSACPIPDFAKREGAVRDEATAQRVAARLVVAEAAAAQAKAALKGYAEAHGSIPVKAGKGKTVWGFKSSESVLRPKREELEEALRAGQVNLDTLYRKRVSTKFTQHTPVPEPDASDDLLAQLEESLRLAQRKG